MATSARTRVPFRRRREGRTDYRRRLGLLRSGQARVVIRRTNGNIIVQFAQWGTEGDQVKASAVALELASHGWEGSAKNTPAAYLTGLLAGKRAAEAGVKEAMLDIGRHAPVRGAKVFAALKGVVDAGVHVPVGDEDIFPSDDRLRGEVMGQQKNFEAVRAKLDVGTPAAKSTDEEE